VGGTASEKDFWVGLGGMAVKEPPQQQRVNVHLPSWPLPDDIVNAPDVNAPDVLPRPTGGSEKPQTVKKSPV